MNSKSVLSELQWSEEGPLFFRQVLDGLLVFVGILRVDGVLVEVNRAPLTAAGIDYDAVVGCKVWDTYWWNYSEDSRQVIKDAIYRCSLGESLRFEVVVRMAGDSRMLIDFMIAPIVNSQGTINYLVASANDLSQRRFVEQSLLQSEEQFRQTFEFAPMGIAQVDLEGRWLRVNDKLLQILGYSKKELLACRYQDITYAVDLVENLEMHTALLEKRLSNFETEKRYIHRSGRLIWVHLTIRLICDDNQRPHYFIAIIEDIDKRKKTEQELSARESLFRLVFESAPSGLLLVSAEQKIQLINRVAEEMFGYRREELFGASLEQLIPERYRHSHSHFIGGYLDEPQARSMGIGRELWARRKDGTEFTIEVGLNPVETDNGFLVLAAVLDVTATKEARAFLQATLEEKTTLLNEVHHRVKNNLQVVSSLLNLQSEHAIPDVRAALEVSQGRLRAMALIHQLLYESANYSRIHLGDYLKRLGSFLCELHAEKNRKITLNMQGLDQTVFIGIQRAVPCGLLVNELVTNAFKHAFADKAKGHVDIILTICGDEVVIVVQDDGCGLPDRVVAGEINSLGFQLIHLLIEQAKGQLNIENSSGTRFEIRLAEVES